MMTGFQTNYWCHARGSNIKNCTALMCIFLCCFLLHCKCSCSEQHVSMQNSSRFWQCTCQIQTCLAAFMCIAVMALPALHCTHVAVLLFIACQDVDKIHQQLLCIMHSRRKFGGRGNSCIGLTPVPYYLKAMCVNRIKLSTEEHDQHAPVMMQLCVGNSMWHSIWSRLSG